MRVSNKRVSCYDILPRGDGVRQVGEVQCSDRRFYKDWKIMNSLLFGHKFIILCIVVLAFFTGGLHRGLTSLAEKKNSELLLMMDLKQLTEVKLDV